MIAPGRPRFVLGIRWLATGAAVALTVAAALAVGAQSERAARTALRHEIEARLQLQARSLAASSADALLEDYPELTLHPLVRDIRQQQRELTFLVVVDHLNRIQGHADARMLGSPFAAPDGASDLESAGSRAERLSVAGDMLVARAPVLHRNGQVLGAAYAGLPLSSIDRTVRAARRGQALLLALFTAVGAALAFVLMSLLLRPIATLRAGLERIGRGDLDSPIPVTGHTELGLLAGTVNDMALAVKRAQAQMLERERLAHELGLAREIQRSLLPAAPVTAGPFEVRGDQNAAAEVGGDYWDVFTLEDGRVGVAIADVSGKGLAGCMVMSMLSALLRALRRSYESPAELLAALDERLSESLRPGVFVTVTYGVLDPGAGLFTFASAGHNPLLLWRRKTGAVEIRASKGIPIGAIRGGAIRATLRDEIVEFEPGDLCLQYTDGHSEAFRAGSDEQFGVDRMRETIAAHAPEGAAAVIRALSSAVRAWSGEGPALDDETLVVLACDPRAAAFPRNGRAETAGEAEVRAALDLLARAERAGRGLELAARLEDLAALEPWLRALPDFAGTPAPEFELVRLALYELCANIVEHGCAEDRRPGLAVWWLADRAEAPKDGAAHPGTTAAAVPRGRFVLRDDGRPFRPGERRATDFTDPGVRTRGRGLGLEIIHRAAAGVRYRPATARGNITELEVGPDRGSGAERIAA